MGSTKSFDIVGDIAIFNKKITKIQAKNILDSHKNIKVVAYKSGKYSGRLRTPKITILAGERRKTTTHKESGCTFKLDIEKCYFSSRSGSERLRIARLVKKNEFVLVMFSGIAAFPIVISKNSKAKEIHAIELGKTPHKYAKENIKLNKINNVKLHQGDVKRILPKIKKNFDRIIMPLPKSAESYLNLALKKLKPKGTIHLYTFANESQFKDLKKKYKKVKITKAGQYSPKVYRVCLDFKK